MKHPPILGIDRWSKYMGLAYLPEDQIISQPIGYMPNDGNLYFSLADIFARHRIAKVAIGYPKRQKNIQERIDTFISKVKLVVDPSIEFERVDEDYTSVQSGEVVSNFKKNVAEDTVSAMIILDRRILLND